MSDLKDKLSEFIADAEITLDTPDDTAEKILQFLTEEYDRQIEEALEGVSL
jgi:hypothetical protein